MNSSLSIPTVFRQTQRRLHSENLNVLENFERRVNDHAYVVRAVILHSKQQNSSEDLIQLLLMLHERINGLMTNFAYSADALKQLSQSSYTFEGYNVLYVF